MSTINNTNMEITTNNNMEGTNMETTINTFDIANILLSHTQEAEAETKTETKTETTTTDNNAVSNVATNTVQDNNNVVSNIKYQEVATKSPARNYVEHVLAPCESKWDNKANDLTDIYNVKRQKEVKVKLIEARIDSSLTDIYNEGKLPDEDITVLVESIKTGKVKEMSLLEFNKKYYRSDVMQCGICGKKVLQENIDYLRNKVSQLDGFIDEVYVNRIKKYDYHICHKCQESDGGVLNKETQQKMYKDKEFPSLKEVIFNAISMKKASSGYAEIKHPKCDCCKTVVDLFQNDFFFQLHNEEYKRLGYTCLCSKCREKNNILDHTEISNIEEAKDKYKDKFDLMSKHLKEAKKHRLNR